MLFFVFFFFSSRRRHTRLQGDWSSDVCSSDLYNFSFSIGPALALMETVAELDLLEKPEALRSETTKPTRIRAGHLELRSVAFAYPLTNKLVLKDVNLVVKAGERVGIWGASGSGKSTLIEILAGLYAPSGGAVLVYGRSVTEDPKPRQAAIGYRSEEHTSELQSPCNLVCRLLLEKKKKNT